MERRPQDSATANALLLKIRLWLRNARVLVRNAPRARVLELAYIPVLLVNLICWAPVESGPVDGPACTCRMRPADGIDV